VHRFKSMQEAKENTDAQTSPAVNPPAPLIVKKRPAFKAPAFVAPAKASKNNDFSKQQPGVASTKPPLPLQQAPAAAGPKAVALKTLHPPSARTLLPPSTKPSAVQTSAPQANEAAAYYFSVLYAKYQPAKKLRKNKAFSDGILEIKSPGNKATLYEPEGKVITATVLRGYTPSTLGNGSEVILGGFELEVDEILPAERFTSGDAFLKPSAKAPVPSSGITSNTSDSTNTEPPSKPKAIAVPFRRPAAPGAAPPPRPPPQQLHDPYAPSAVVLNAAQWQGGAGKDASGHPIAAVVLDPVLARCMRPHQIEGVQFLYECTTGSRQTGQNGAILADSMGLGKTLTTIALLWTLLRQSPAGAKPTSAKAIVVAPSSLTRNWAAEVRKWLGDERLRTIIIPPGAEGASQALAFKHGSVARVAITSYETLRQHASSLAGCAGILIADEGHRLKSAQGNKTISALLALQCPRRVILSGTIMQNQLSEFFSLADFVCPDVLGSLPTFNRIFATPISRSRDRNASKEERELGEARSAELSRRVESFILRRGAEVNAKFLPPLSSYVVFCRPSDTQIKLLAEVLGSTSVRSLLGATGSDFGDQVLSVLGNLRKICNHPALFTSSSSSNKEESDSLLDGCEKVETTAPDLSGKMAALHFLLHKIVHEEQGRCVVVSQSTAMLDLISTSVCVANGYTTVRIDGKCDVNKRQDVVDSFNNHGVGQIFLLSTTAGGAGLNLTGANRLILVDSHWNPALDQQAMARVWRDGQKLPCTIYRLLSVGTLEEKIFQRQRAKGDIAAVTIYGDDTSTDAASGAGTAAAGTAAGSSKGASSSAMASAINNNNAKKKGGQFSRDELKQLFTVRTDTACDTADVLGAAEFVDDSSTCADGPLSAAVAAGLVSYVHLENQQGHPSDHHQIDAEAAAVAVAVGEREEEEDEDIPSAAGGGGDNKKDSDSLEEENDDDMVIEVADVQQQPGTSSDGASQLEIDDDDDEV
jgi:DNA repair and recombination protein RAD54B